MSPGLLLPQPAEPCPRPGQARHICYETWGRYNLDHIVHSYDCTQRGGFKIAKHLYLRARNIK